MDIGEFVTSTRTLIRIFVILLYVRLASSVTGG